MQKKQLQHHIRTGIPISEHMDFRVLELSPTAITVCGGGAENINVHGTAFAGSLYSISTLAIWGLVFSRLPEGASLVMAEATIRYRRPVIGDITARCEILSTDFEAFLNAVNRQAKGRLKAVALASAGDGAVAAELNGLVYARLNKD